MTVTIELDERNAEILGLAVLEAIVALRAQLDGPKAAEAARRLRLIGRLQTSLAPQLPESFRGAAILPGSEE